MLVTSLVFLVVLTMFVLALVRSGTLEERMARNARDQQVAREAAEAMLRDAEAVSFKKPPFDPYDASEFTGKCLNGLCRKAPAGATWDTLDWSNANLTRAFSETKFEIGHVTTQPRYIVEIVTAPYRTSSSTQCEPGVARVTARGVGGAGAIAFVQTTVRFRVFSGICD
ncbi:MAG TPA: PilX N-terminal domain-containing pilus assembly protein [Telluria sp.]